MEKRFLLGTIGNKIVIGNVCLYENRNSEKEFTASFDIGEAFSIDDIDTDYLTDYYEDLFNNVEDETKLDWLQEGDITRYDWIESQVNNYNDYKNIIDCSCTDLEMEYTNSCGEDVNINFKSTCVGQHDIRKEDGYNDMKYTNRPATEELLYLWDNYHLSSIKDNKKALEMYERVIKMLSYYEWDKQEENIKTFIQDNLEF